MKLKIVQDVVRSWCPVGRSNLRVALATFDRRIEAGITSLPFDLNPAMGPGGKSFKSI